MTGKGFGSGEDNTKDRVNAIGRKQVKYYEAERYFSSSSAPAFSIVVDKTVHCAIFTDLLFLSKNKSCHDTQVR